MREELLLLNNVFVNKLVLRLNPLRSSSLLRQLVSLDSSFPGAQQDDLKKIYITMTSRADQNSGKQVITFRSRSTHFVFSVDLRRNGIVSQQVRNIRRRRVDARVGVFQLLVIRSRTILRFCERHASTCWTITVLDFWRLVRWWVVSVWIAIAILLNR